MADEKNIKRANNVYETICNAHDKIGFKYEKYPEDLVVKLGIAGDDFPMELLYVVNAEVECVSLYSYLPFSIPEDKKTDIAVAVAIANYGLINGSFDFDMDEGRIRYRLVSSYIGSILGEELFLSMTANVSNTVDMYNDKFFMIIKNMMTLDQFIEWEKSDK